MSNLTEEQKEQIGAEIENQGLDYWITNYGTFEGDDKKLEELISNASEAMNAVENYLTEHDIMF